MTVPTGWFSDTDGETTNSDGTPMWQPVIQTSYVCASIEVWFPTEADCDTFIRDEILTVGLHPGEGQP